MASGPVRRGPGTPTRTSPTKRGLKHRESGSRRRTGIADENLPDEEGTETAQLAVSSSSAVLPTRTSPTKRGLKLAKRPLFLADGRPTRTSPTKRGLKPITSTGTASGTNPTRTSPTKRGLKRLSHRRLRRLRFGPTRTSPTKRGLKRQARQREVGHAVPTRTSPTKRGLKPMGRCRGWSPSKGTDENLPDEEGTETVASAPAMAPGAVRPTRTSPTKRGLKHHNPRPCLRFRQHPTRTSPTKRGLKLPLLIPVGFTPLADENLPDEEGTETRLALEAYGLGGSSRREPPRRRGD